jgi:2,5-diketo-D-gluconate reductase A
MSDKTLLLNDGNSMPRLGLGLWRISDDETTRVVQEAIKAGYRSFDSAQIYQNEAGLGRAIKECSLKRDELFITTKIWNSEQGRDSTLRSFDVSMDKLGLERLDLLLIHWPAPRKKLYVETWKALVEIQKQGRVRSIGVSNFYEEHLKEIMDSTGVIPVVNQVELHPRFQQRPLRAFHAQHKIITESWSPLGQGQVLNDPEISKIAEKHKKTPAQIVIRWHLQQDLIVIPKSVTHARIKENFDVFDFKLDATDMKLISKMDDANGRIGWDPMTANF